MKKNQIVFTTLLIGMLVALFIVFTQDGHQLDSKYKRLNLSLGSEITNLDPAIAYNDDALTLISQPLESLYQYHYLKRPFEIVPQLAESMPKISNDGKVYTIKIKKGVYYHDHPAFVGRKRELKALDFVNQIKRLAFKGHNSNGRWIVDNRIKGANKFALTVGEDFKNIFNVELEGAIAIDDYTLKITLNQPDPNLIYFLAMTFTTPVPKEIILYHENDLHDVLIGTGPYYLHKVESTERYILKKFADFHGEVYPSSGDRYANTKDLLIYAKQKLPFIDEVTFHIIPKDEKRFSEFKDRNLDLLSVPFIKMDDISNPESDVSKFFKKNNIETKMFSTLIFRWLGFNMQDPVFKNSKFLREAIAYAIDYNTYSQILNKNTSLRANSIFNPGIPGYNPSQSLDYKFDIKKAKKILKKHGHPNGKGIPTIRYSTRSNGEINLIEAKFIKESLAKIGLKVEVEVLSFKEFLNLGRSGKLQFWTDNWIYDYPDSENILQLLLSSNHPGINKSAYANKKFDFLYGKLAETRDLAERLSYMESMEKIVLNDLPWVPLFYETSYTVTWPNVKNFRKSFFTRNFVKYLDLQ